MLNKDILRWVLMLGSAPIWLPFLLTLWKDFNDALREDGGLIGEPPTPAELAIIKKERAMQPEMLVNEPIVRAGDRRKPRMGGASRPAPATDVRTNTKFR